MMFEGFDYLGQPTGKLCMLCSHQFENCEYQSPYGEGAFFICKNEKSIKLEKCIKDINILNYEDKY